MEKIIKVAELSEKGISPIKEVTKDILERLRGRVLVFDSDKSEIAKNLKINEKGVYGIRFK